MQYNNCNMISSPQQCIYYKYVQHNTGIGFVYINGKTKANSYNQFFIIIYTVYIFTISNLIIIDFDNPQVASFINPFTFSYHYNKHIFYIYLYYTYKALQV